MQWLTGCDQSFTYATSNHPVLSAFPATRVKDYQPGRSGPDKGPVIRIETQQLVNRILEIGKRPEGVSLADTGHPCRDSLGRPGCIPTSMQNRDIPITVIAGLSWSELVMQMTGYLPVGAAYHPECEGSHHTTHAGFPPNHSGSHITR